MSVGYGHNTYPDELHLFQLKLQNVEMPEPSPEDLFH